MRIAVLGAGVTGLTAGHRLAQAGNEVDVYERWPGLGGQVATLDVGGGHLLERYYHHLFTSDVHIAALYLLALASLFVFVPAGPGNVGTLDAAVVFGARAIGRGSAGALSFLILLRLVLIVPITLVGFGFLVARYR